jgi:hypothetical protein
MMSIQNDRLAGKPRWQIDRWIWQRCSAPGTLLLLLIPILLALVASHWLPQIPAHLRSDPIGYQERLSAIQIQFKNWTPVLIAIGAFHIEDTLWFRLLLASLAFILFVSLGSEIGDLLKPQPIRQPPEFYRSADTVVLSGKLPHDQVVEAVQETLESDLGRIRRESQDAQVHLYGERAAYARVGAAVIYLGLLFLVAGLAANGRWGWQQTNIRVPPNEPAVIGPEGNHHIQIVSVETGPAETIALEINGSRSLLIRWGATGRRGSYRYEWISKGGPFVQVYALGPDQEKLTLYNYESRPQPVKTLQFAFSPRAPQQEADRLFIVADTKVVGRLVWLNKNAENDEKPRFYLWTFGEDRRTPLADQEFVASEPSAPDHTLTAQIGDITYVLDVKRYVVLDVAYQPGLSALWIGSILCAGGVAVSLIPRKQTWAVIATDQHEYEIRIRRSRPLVRVRGRQQDRWLDQLRSRISRA